MENAWKKYRNDLDTVMTFNNEYMDYLSQSKTEREAVASAISLARTCGFKEISEYPNALKANDKVYFVNRDKNVCFYVIGKEDVVKGINVLGAHIDSPRVDIKANPLYEADGLALFDTHYYGGIKKYQWVATPMAMHGVVCKKDGSTVAIEIGEKESDPVLGFTDLLIHLSADQMKKTGATVVEGEDLNLSVGSIPLLQDDDQEEEKEPVKAYILKLLKDLYDIEEADFLSAELEIVPAGKARSYGLDSSMVMGYGHDDRVCAYTSLRAIMEIENPTKTVCCILVDKEEVGSIGATGAQSRFFENTIADIISKTEDYNDLKLRKTLRNSYMRGKSGCNDANPEYIAKIRAIMDEANIVYQAAELGKVDQGGGGTIAYILANLDMEVIDAGIPVLNMHAPWEVVSKVDVYEAYLAYKVFLNKIGE